MQNGEEHRLFLSGLPLRLIMRILVCRSERSIMSMQGNHALYKIICSQACCRKRDQCEAQVFNALPTDVKFSRPQQTDVECLIVNLITFSVDNITTSGSKGCEKSEFRRNFWTAVLQLEIGCALKMKFVAFNFNRYVIYSVRYSIYVCYF